MPELPEVETIVRRLQSGTDDHPPVPGHSIHDVRVFWDRIIQEPDPITFKDRLLGRTILNVSRRGKFLHFPLDHGHLIGHLRMSGDMRMEPALTSDKLPLPEEKYDQVILDLVGDWRLVFSSIRKFSRMWFVEDPQRVFGDLGPEPLSPDFSPELLFKMLHKHRRQLKPLLMDQTFIAGLGNIYSDETLFSAKIHPLRRSETLSKEEAVALFNGIRKVLNTGIENFGASLDWMYRGGQFQNSFKVHQREAQHCPECDAKIIKLTVGQRSTYICPRCQQLLS
jgi:formamidopyrimidine-DNA glycosylase